MLEVRSQEQLHAVADPTRRRILSLLRERAASTTELAEALGQPKGTAGHHVKVLEEAKLIRVVRTRKVRAMTESYYGRLARLYRIVADEAEPYDPAGIGALMLRQAADEVAPDAGKGDDPSSVVVVHARVADGDARRFAQRLEELASDFQSYDDEDERVFGFVVGRLRDRPARPAEEEERSEEAVRALWPSGGLWRHPDFLKLWTAETISQFGTQVSGLALPFVAIVVLDASAFAVAALGTVEFLPFLLFTLPAGVWVDRLRRRAILIVADYGRAVLLLSVPIAYAFDALTLPQLFVVGFLVGIFTVFFDVAYQSYLPSLVDRDADHRRQLEARGQSHDRADLRPRRGRRAHRPDHGAVRGARRRDQLSRVRRVPDGIRKQEEKPAVPEGGKPRMRTELWEGLQYVVRHPLLRPQAICTGTSNFFSNVMFSIFLVYAVRTLELSAAEIGIIFTLGSLGGLVGALASQRVSKRFGVGRTTIAMTFIFGTAGFLVPLAPVDFPYPFLIASLLVSSFAIVVYNITQVSLRQAIAPKRIQGRMNSVMRFLVWGTIPLGTMTGGVLATTIGLRPTLFVGAAGALLSTLPILLSRAQRTLVEFPESEEPEPLTSAPATWRRCRLLP